MDLDCRLLFEFHSKENAKKPQSVHATYVISGIQKPPEPPATNGHVKDDDDEIMQSSPYLPSSMPNQDAASDSSRIASIILAREEDLEGGHYLSGYGQIVPLIPGAIE
jgi:DNA polymerase delta subunit 3